MKLFSKRALLGPQLVETAACLHIDGHRIVHIEPRPDAPSDATDLGSKILAPAWVNAHTHVALVSLRGMAGLAMQGGNMVEELYFRVERSLEPADVRALAKVGAVDCLLSGTGAVWDHYYHGIALAEALSEAGLCAALAPALQDIEGPGVPWLEQHFSELDALDSPAWRARGVVPVIGPHATDTVSPALWRRCRDLAIERGWPVHFHIAQSPEELERCWTRHGCGPVELINREGLLAADIRLLMVHALYLSEAELGLLDPSRHTLGYCPAAQAQFDFPAPEALWRRRGLSFVLGTDAGSCNDTMDPQAELRMLAAGPAWSVGEGEAAKAFRADPCPATLAELRTDRSKTLATREDNVGLLRRISVLAGGLHPQMPVGQISTGYWANLMVVDPDAPSLWPGTSAHQALAFAQVQPAIWGLMVRGAWIGHPGDLRGGLLGGSWWRETQQEAREHLEGLLKRAKG